MIPNNIDDDPVLATLRELRGYDVGPARAQRLRNRCHKALEQQYAAPSFSVRTGGNVWRRALPALAGTWCVVYLFETIRRAAAVFGF
jgi:hypothetical protein